MHVLVTGAAGFIGYHLTCRLLADGHDVTGIDNLNDYYDPALKRDRLTQINLKARGQFRFEQIDLADGEAVAHIFAQSRFSHVVNLAAQAGVRYSLRNPVAYVNANLVGFANVLEGCRNNKVCHLVFASSSSVYGMNARHPYTEHDNVDHPVSLYAATKKSNELMAHAYSHLFALPCTGLRFFTVYGPWGRPDMALHLFTMAILKGEPIKLFNHGQMKRDFTYIDDIVEGIVRVLDHVPQSDSQFSAENPDPASSSAPWRIYNIGNNTCVELAHFVDILEETLGKKAIRQMLPMQEGDVQSTWADISALVNLTGFAPATPLKTGMANFVNWFRKYYKM